MFIKKLAIATMVEAPLIFAQVRFVNLRNPSHKVSFRVKAVVRQNLCQVSKNTGVNVANPSRGVVPLHVIDDQLTASCVDLLSVAQAFGRMDSDHDDGSWSDRIGENT